MSLTIGMMFAKAKLAAETYQLIKSFVVDELPNLLSAIGDSQFRAAATAANDARLSDQPQREITIVLGHLHGAIEVFRTIEDSEWKKVFGDPEKAREARQKRIASLLLMTMCYAYLGSRNLLERYAAELRDTFLEHCRNTYSHGSEDPSLNRNAKALDVAEEELISLFHSLELQAWSPHGWHEKLVTAWRESKDAENEPQAYDADWRTNFFL